MKNILKKIVSVLLSVLTIFSLALYVSAENEIVDSESDNLNVISIENNNFILELNKENGSFVVKNKISNAIWYSNPIDAELDETATGKVRTNLRSQVIVDYIEDKTHNTANNLVGSINRDGAKFKQGKDYIKAEYTFVNEEFYIPVEYRLTNKGFSAKIILSEVKEKNTKKINSIILLPFFGSGGINDSGYMFIPDGSGALIEFNNGKQEYTQYKKPVYGIDCTIQENVNNNSQQNILIPMYGIKKGDNAFSAVITKGAELANIHAEVSGNQCAYNRIYTSVMYRESRVLLAKSGGSSLFEALNPVSAEEYEITFNILDSKNSNYVGMANSAKELLLKDSIAKNNKNVSSPIVIDMYGAIQKDMAFLGIRYTGNEKLTTYKQALEILKQLDKNGISSINVGYYNFSKNSISGKVSSNVKLNGTLGSSSDYRKLYNFAKEKNTGIYPYADFVKFNNGGNGYNKFSGVTIGLDLSASKYYPYDIISNKLDNLKAPTYFISANKYNKAIKQLTKSLKKTNVTGALLKESVNKVYSDFSKGGYQRDRTVSSMISAYEKIIKTDKKLMLSAPNAYAMPYASAITDLPLCSSKHLLFDKDVPVLQIILSGIVDYSSKSVNIDYSDDSILQHIETGSFVKFSVIASETRKIKGTELSYLYGATFDNCSKMIYEVNNNIKDFYKAINGASIIEHTNTDGIAKVMYDNGVKVTVNFTDNPCFDDSGKTVEPKSYSFTSGV